MADHRSLTRMLVGLGIGPLAQRGLDEPLGLAVNGTDRCHAPRLLSLGWFRHTDCFDSQSTLPSTARSRRIHTSYTGGVMNEQNTNPSSGSPGLTGSGSCGPIGSFGGPLNCNSKIDGLATFAGRVGFAVDHALIYLTGGGAWAHEKFAVSNNGANPLFITCGTSGSCSSGAPPRRLHQRRPVGYGWYRHRIHVRAKLVGQSRV
jgi:hypothetical protein